MPDDLMQAALHAGVFPTPATVSGGGSQQKENPVPAAVEGDFIEPEANAKFCLPGLEAYASSSDDEEETEDIEPSVVEMEEEKEKRGGIQDKAHCGDAEQPESSKEVEGGGDDDDDESDVSSISSDESDSSTDVDDDNKTGNHAERQAGDVDKAGKTYQELSNELGALITSDDKESRQDSRINEGQNENDDQTSNEHNDLEADHEKEKLSKGPRTANEIIEFKRISADEAKV